MSRRMILPNQENIHSTDANKTVYYFYDAESKPIHKARIDFKKEAKFIVYPYSFNKNKGEIKRKRIREIELKGWNEFNKLPKDFKLTPGYGFKTKRIKNVFGLIYPKFKTLYKASFAFSGNNKFTPQKISIGWNTFEPLLKKVSKESAASDRDRKGLIIHLLAETSKKFKKIDRKLSAGELGAFLSKFDSFETITKDDANSIAKTHRQITRWQNNYHFTFYKN